MWHCSVSGKTDKETLRRLAMAELDGVGDVQKGQWEEWTGRAYHIRRRLHDAEEVTIGPAVDCRGTAEWNRRYDAAKMELPEMAKRLASQEMMESL